ncbi:MAG: response regulator transcription factor [Anaerolineae bacterium]|nr:response regulator transcription factor [Anaerolineae bacterium]
MFVILADDQYDVRCALRLILEQEADLELASEAANSTELLAQLGDTCPDLLLLDWELPGLGVAELLAAARRQCPDVKIIALSGRPEACEQAMQAGVPGFVSKGDPPERLLEALRSVLRISSRRS